MSLLLALNWIGIFKGLIFIFFILSSMLLILIVLLQEPKGGGLSGAFGGAGAETFGVQTGGVNKFTSWVAAIFLGLAVIYAAWTEDDPAAPSEIYPETTLEDPDAGTPANGNSGDEDPAKDETKPNSEKPAPPDKDK